MVESRRGNGGPGIPETVEYRYYISSRSAEGPEAAARFAAAVRGHWGIENGLHWVLDMSFREDESRIRRDHAPANMATLRHLALNLLRREKTAKVRVNAKRLKAGWDEGYLERLLFNEMRLPCRASEGSGVPSFPAAAPGKLAGMCGNRTHQRQDQLPRTRF